jgi:hypothetical protein
MARRRRRQPSDDEADGVDRLAEISVRCIKAVAILLGLTVTFLELKDTPLDRITQTFDNAALIKIGLVIFFFGWLWGATQDTEIQRIGYCRDPRKGRIGAEEIAGMVVFIAVFGALFALHDDPVWFQLFLLVFILVNMWTWRVIFRRTIPIIEASVAGFTADLETRDNCSLAKLLVVVMYMNGPWQRSRFFFLILLAGLQLAIALLVSSGWLGASLAGYRVTGVSGDVLVGYLPGALFILYVLISEIWMKAYRIKVFSDVVTIGWLEAHFRISKRPDVALPDPHLGGLFDFSEPKNRNYAAHGPLSWFISVN